MNRKGNRWGELAQKPNIIMTTDNSNYSVSKQRRITEAANTVHPHPSTKERMDRIDQELLEAAAENNLREVRRLLSVGADVNARGNHLCITPLIVASFKGFLAVFQALLEHGADPEAKDNGGWMPLHWACWNGHLAMVNELLSPNDSNGTLTTLGKRKSRGADIDATDNNGNTPLHGASAGGHVAIVQSLLSGGADILSANNQGLLPIHKAVSFGKSEVVKYLLQELYATTRSLPLHELLEDLAWIGNPNNSDVPPLLSALHRNVLGTNDVVEILEYLVERKPELLRSCDEDGSLPLHVACRRGISFAIVQSLVNHYKASVKSVTPQGDLPLFLACETPEPSLDTIFFLIKQYPDLVY
jgi:ankyrin repeat protein